MGAPASSFKAVITALGANVFITIIKFIGFLFSGSGAMLSEAIHSAADTANQFLLFLGLKRGSRAADDKFNYGYGGERFVFGILSAAGIFFIGCGVTVYHGVHSLLHPHAPDINWLTFAILAVSLLVEGSSTFIAIKAVLHDAKGESLFNYLIHKADPAAKAIIAEDSAAVLGILLAVGGVALAHFTGNPMWDAFASITIGLLLGVVAIFLVLENRGLLLGEAAPDDVEKKFVEILKATPGIKLVHNVKSRQITPEAYNLKAEIIVDDVFIAKQIYSLLKPLPIEDAFLDSTIETVVKSTTNNVSIIIENAESRVRKEIPQAKYIDIEVDNTPDSDLAA